MSWLDDLAKAVLQEPDKIPKGFLTTAQAAKQTGKSVETMRRMFNAGIKKGLIERRLFKLRIATGHIVKAPHYGPKK